MNYTQMTRPDLTDLLGKGTCPTIDYSLDSRRLYLPVKKVINDIFQISIKLIQTEDYTNNRTHHLWLLISHFDIIALYVPRSNYKSRLNLKFGTTIEVSMALNPQVSSDFKRRIEQDTFSRLAGIEFILSLPIDRLPLYIDSEEEHLMSLIAWRLDLPRLDPP
jgi:hypothetical protein